MLDDHLGVAIGLPHLRGLAHRSEQVVGEFNLKDMARLQPLLLATEGGASDCLDVRVRFHGGLEGFPEISGTVSGSLALRCQRCLGVLMWPLNLDFRLVVVESDNDMENIADPFDALVAGEDGIRLIEVVEDEILGSLPLAPAHADAADCNGAAPASFVVVGDSAVSSMPDAKAAVEETARPFEGLADMLKRDVDSDSTD